MAYTPPAGDAVPFNFTADGYVAPAGDAIVFNFADALPRNLLVLGVQWATTAQDERGTLGAQWETLCDREARIIHASLWATTGTAYDTGKLGARWETEGQPSAYHVLGSQWATVPAEVATSRLGTRWATEVGAHVAVIGVQWATLAAQPHEALLGAQWQTEGQPFGDLVLGAQWITAGAPSGVLVLGDEWVTLGVTEGLAVFGAKWETLTPMIDTTILGSSWFDLSYVEQALTILYYDEIGQAVEIDAPIGLTDVAQQVVLDSQMLTAVAQQLVLTSALGDVTQACELPSPLLGSVAQQCVLDSSLLTEVTQAVELDSPITEVDQVAQQLVIVSPILGDSQVIVRQQQTLSINGHSVKLADVSISQDEGEFAWTCEATLLDPREYALFAANDTFTVDLGGEVYTFLVESKRMARTGVAAMEASIAGIGPAAQYANPRGNRVTKTWDTAVLASSTATELIPTEAIDWRILDWSIPPLRLAVQNETPIEILSRVAAAAGGLIESNPDGTMYVRYAYPDVVADYPTLTPAQSYSDVLDRFSVSEGFSATPIVNKIRIMDVAPGAFADVIEFEADRLNPTEGKLRVYPSPWRETFSLEHTSLPIVSIERLGEETAEHTETVEVVRGEGSVQFPIYSVSLIEWLYADLGGVTFSQDTRQFKSTSETAKESLVRITYTTRFIDYRAVAFEGADVQFVVREPELG